MKVTEECLLFESTGKTIDYPSYAGYVGICVSDPGKRFDGSTMDMEVTEGYDSTYHEVTYKLTQEEREEFADFMISRWQKWKNSPQESLEEATTPKKFDCYEIHRPNVPQHGCTEQCKECAERQQKKENGNS